jgi:hypothetical protein
LIAGAFEHLTKQITQTPTIAKLPA